MTAAGDTAATAPTATLRHNRVELALHRIREATGDAHPLLLLHGLGERTPDHTPDVVASWDGEIWGLDFTGHGASTLPVGGGYTAEILMGDADLAVDHLGTCTVVGRGLGGYVALLIAGARPDVVHGAVIADGPGLTGGAVSPTSQAVVRLADAGRTPDPYALLELGRDLRPPDYALDFVQMATSTSHLDEPLCVAAAFRPTWLEAVAGAPGVAQMRLPDALDLYR